MNTPRWSTLLMGEVAAANTTVFSGGACNTITVEGQKTRSTGRDSLNDWLEELGIPFFDPQIHPDTHGRDYDYDQDGPAEQVARAVAQVTLYEIAGGTLGAVTHLEALADALRGKDNVVIWFNSSLDAKGKPLFEPLIDVSSVQGLAAVHLTEYKIGGDNVRKNLVAFVGKLPNVTIVYTLGEAQAAIEKSISPPAMP